jgi:hypothetical protein
MQDLQARANPSSTLFITRNEQEGGTSPLVGSLFFPHLQVKHSVFSVTEISV